VQSVQLDLLQTIQFQRCQLVAPPVHQFQVCQRVQVAPPTPAASEGITGYNVELSANGNGSWVLVATVPATQFKQQITKTDDAGWAQVKVSTVYSDGEVVAGKVHGLPGSWS